MTRVLLAVDESDESVAAVQAARQLFGADCDFLAVNVAERVPAWWSNQPRWGGVYPFPFDATHPLGDEFPDADVPDPAAHAAAKAEATAASAAARGGVVAAPVTEFGDAPAAWPSTPIVRCWS